MMKCAIVLAFLCAASGSTVTPVQKVVQLLNGMVEKGKKEKHEEQVQFATYKQFCESTTGEKQRAIKEANQNIESLQADIGDAEATAATRTKEIATTDGEVATWEGNLKAANQVRESEAEDYAATYKDYGESIAALEEGIATLKKENHATSQASAALVQVASSPKIPLEQRRVIDAFLQQDPEETLAVAAPEANAYEFQAQGIVDMLEGLLDKFNDERSDLEKMEMNAKNSFEMLAMDLKHQIEDATQSVTEKTEEKATALQNAAAAKSDMADTTSTRDDDSKYLSD